MYMFVALYASVPKFITIPESSADTDTHRIA